MAAGLGKFGRKCRHHRLETDKTIADQALKFKCSPQHVSAVERKLTPIPSGYAEKFIEWLQLDEAAAQELLELAAQERKVVKIIPRDLDRALLADEFARRLNNVSLNKLAKLRRVLLTEDDDGDAA